MPPTTSDILEEYKQTLTYLDNQGLCEEFKSKDLLTIIKKLNERRNELEMIAIVTVAVILMMLIVTI